MRFFFAGARTALRFLANAVAKGAQLFARRKIFPVHVAGKVALVYAELAVFVQVLLVDVHAHDVGQEHVVAAQRGDGSDPAFQIDRALGDERRAHLVGLKRGQLAGFKLIDLPARFDAAPVRLPHQGCWGEVDDEFSALFDELIGVAAGAHRDVGHRGLGVDDAGPGHGDDVRLFHCAAADHGGGNGRQEGGAFPEYFCHIFLPFHVEVLFSRL